MSLPQGISSLLSSLGDSALRDRLALTFYRGRTRAGQLTYGELLSSVDRIAGYLERELQVRPGDRILILSPNRIEIPAILLGIMRVGGVVVPLNPFATPEDWSYIAKHSEARGAFVAKDLMGRLQPSLEFKVDIDEVTGLSAGTVAAPVDKSDDDVAIVLYTSGTTGNPKGVALTQRNLLANGRSMALNFGLDQTTQFAVLPLYHAHALGFGLMTALTTRGHLVFTERLDPFAWAEVIRTEAVTFTSVVPSLLPMLLAARVHRSKVPTLEAMLVSSAPLSAEMAREFEAKTEIPLIQGWGLSEYTNFACCLSPRDGAEDHRALLLDPEIPSVGSALDGTEVKITDDTGKPLGEGVAGELWVRGPSMMKGYYRDPEATRGAMDQGWLRTGDQGYFRLHPPGSGKPVYFITGRIKEIIIRSGEKFSPIAIEKKILAAVAEAAGKLAVVGFAHRAHGEEVGAYLEATGANDDLIERVSSAIQGLPLEMRPKILLCSPEPIPRTHTGKVQRRKLQPLFQAYADCKGPTKLVVS